MPHVATLAQATTSAADVSLTVGSLTGSLAGHWTWIDWVVLIGYLAITTFLGHALSGKQATIKDFFLGGRKLPWYAVTGSSIATEISAVTFIGVPATIFAAGGNFTYMQLGIVAGLLSRLFVAFVLVPAYYRNLVYSPYDYMANQLGGGVRGVTTALFTVGGVLAQAARVYLTALILDLILSRELGWLEAHTGLSSTNWAILLIGCVAVLWTIIGGIASVIWTDVILFVVFVVGGLIAIGYIIAHLHGGFGELVTTASQAGKFKLWDLDYKLDPAKEYTIWTALIASTLGNVGAYGTDQLMAQRIFCCKDAAQAKIAVLAGYLGLLVTALMFFVGAGLFVYYKGPNAIPENAIAYASINNGIGPVAASAGASIPVDQWARPIVGESLEKYAADKDSIFPIYILTVIPTGLTGLIIAGVFAAAISSLDSILAALAQTSMSAVYLPWRNRVLRRRYDLAVATDPSVATYEPVEELTIASVEGRRTMLISKLLVVGWGVAMVFMAFGIGVYKSRSNIPILPLALGLAGLVQGALLAAFFLAWLPLRVNGRGLIWAAPLSFFTVLFAKFHEPWAQVLAGIVAVSLLATWIATALFASPGPLRTRRMLQTIALVVGIAIMLATVFVGYVSRTVGPAGDYVYVTVAWPWYAPIGAVIAFVFGYLLADPKDDDDVLADASLVPAVV